jgi:hypothetical protein
VSRYVLPLLVTITFAADIYTTGIGHALTWMLGIVTGLALGSAMRDDELKRPAGQRVADGIGDVAAYAPQRRHPRQRRGFVIASSYQVVKST